MSGRKGGSTESLSAPAAGIEWNGVDDLQDAGYEHAHAFEVEGVYEYQCDPHAGSGMDGRIVVGDVDVEATDDGDETDDDGSGPGY